MYPIFHDGHFLLRGGNQASLLSKVLFSTRRFGGTEGDGGGRRRKRFESSFGSPIISSSFTHLFGEEPTSWNLVKYFYLNANVDTGILFSITTNG